MSEVNSFIKAANANEEFRFNVSAIDQPNNQAETEATNNNVMPPLEAFDSKRMNFAWRVCWGTTALILMFLLILWFYYSIRNK